jgi:hypothetical protein
MSEEEKRTHHSEVMANIRREIAKLKVMSEWLVTQDVSFPYTRLEKLEHDLAWLELPRK